MRNRTEDEPASWPGGHTTPVRVWSIGHSTHSLQSFLALLAVYDIAQIADIRAVPQSRRSPHFQTDALARELPRSGVAYVHLPGLGGWRRATPQPPNVAWRNMSFRGYADDAMGAEFAAALARLRALAAQRPTAMMCSEALWWRCHAAWSQTVSCSAATRLPYRFERGDDGAPAAAVRDDRGRKADL